MADRDQKIFPALPQKRERAREQGQIARSRDLTSAISFVAGTLVLRRRDSAGLALRNRRFQRGTRRDRIERFDRRRSGSALGGRLAVAIGSDVAGDGSGAAIDRLDGARRTRLRDLEASPGSRTAQSTKVFRTNLFRRRDSSSSVKSGSQNNPDRDDRLEHRAKWALELAAGAHDIAEGLTALAAGESSDPLLERNRRAGRSRRPTTRTSATSTRRSFG